MGGVRMGVNVDIKRTDGECFAKLLRGAMMILCTSECEYLMPASCWTRRRIEHPRPNISNESRFSPAGVSSSMLDRFHPLHSSHPSSPYKTTMPAREDFVGNRFLRLLPVNATSSSSSSSSLSSSSSPCLASPRPCPGYVQNKPAGKSKIQLNHSKTSTEQIQKGI